MKRATFLPSTLAVVLSALFALTPLASAQPAPTTLPGITVLGAGQASVPAETATVILMLASDAYYYGEPVKGEVPAPATPSASAEEAAAPVIDALVAVGVPEADIELISNPFVAGYGPYPGPTTFTLVFTLADPTSAGIAELLTAALAAASEGGLYPNMMSALYGVADCASLQREARSAAIADAREQATVQAELLGVSLGDVIASRDDTYGAIAYSGMYGGATQYNSCTLRSGFDPMTAIYSAPAFDPSLEPTVTVSAYVELTFAIAPAA